MTHLLHIGLHDSPNSNTGDRLLFPLVRLLITLTSSHHWTLQLWEPFGLEHASHANTTYQAVVIGGGGLFLRDQVGADILNSGWQWNSSISSLRKLTIPIILYGVGYNRFRKQVDFNPIFYDHLTELFSRSIFIGLRNYGSISQLSKSFPDVNFKHQPCPTTILSCLDANVCPKTPDQPIISINLAFDRSQLRFPDGLTTFFKHLNHLIQKLQAQGIVVHIVGHKDSDIDNFMPHLDPYLSPHIVNLTYADYSTVVSYYSSVSLVIGMRGHHK